MHRAARLCAAVAVGASVSPLRAAAQVARDEVITVVYSAPPGCPSEEEFLASVRRRTQRFTLSPPGGDGHRVFRIAIRDTPSLVGKLETYDPQRGESTRELIGNTCSELSDAMALVVALAVDPSGVVPLAAQPLQQDIAASPAREPNPAPHVPNERVAALSVGTARVETPQNVNRRSVYDWRVLLGVGGQASVGPFPSVAFSVPIFVQLLRRREEHALSEWGLSFAATTNGLDAGKAGSAQVAWTRGAFDACPWALYADRFVSVFPCGRFEVGRLAAEGVNVPDQSSDATVWLAAGALARVDWVPVKPVHLQADVGASFPLGEYYVYRDVDQRLYTLSPAAAVFGLSAFWALP